MQEYILILTLSLTGQSDVAIGTAEFSSKTACEEAADRWRSDIDLEFNSIRTSEKIYVARCAPKGAGEPDVSTDAPKLIRGTIKSTS